MQVPAVAIKLDEGAVYHPGDTLSGAYRLEGIDPEQVRSVEVSVLWYSEGKGDEDLAVHQFWRLNPESGDELPLHRPARFSSRLPNSPLSYEGQIVKIRWCVRVRAFLQRGREIVGQAVFRLGDVPPAPPPAEPPKLSADD